MNSPLFKEFKQFLLRGNVIDLAIAFVIGVAFAAVINSFLDDILLQFIAAIAGKPDFSSLSFTVNDAEIRYGNFLTAVVTFVIIAAVVFFFIVKPMNMLIARSRKEPPADPTTMKCSECMSEIPIGARRCAFCTATLV